MPTVYVAEEVRWKILDAGVPEGEDRFGARVGRAGTSVFQGNQIQWICRRVLVGCEGCSAWYGGVIHHEE